MRLGGKTFEEIGSELSLGERQIRRHYEEFLLANIEFYREKKQFLFGQIFAQFENSLEEASKQLTEAAKGDNPAKIAVWQKIRQECLRDYYNFLKDLGFSYYWINEPEKPETEIERLRRILS
jgi:hypothetical protein